MKTTLLATILLAATATGALAQAGQTTQPAPNQNQTQVQTNQSQGTVKQSQ